MKLSVLLVTYNHENYIRMALDNLFNQIFDEQIELIIADDASTDNTLSIIREYENKDSRFLFSYLNNDKNMGITKNYQRGFAACNGQYIAVLEGDDYWISPLKLQKQIEFLDMHKECNLCSVNYFVFQEEISHFYPRTHTSENFRLISARELIADNIVGNFSTCMYRRSALEALPKELYETTSYDWIINISVAMNSFIGFLETPMSVYRLHTSGTWTQMSQIKKLQQQHDLIPIYDELTSNIFHEDFNILKTNLHHRISALNIENAIKEVALPRIGLNTLKDFTPPIVLILVNFLLPPIFKRVILKFLKRNI